MVDLIPGTTLPIHTGPGGEQPEGRGTVTITHDRMPRSLFERIGDRDDVTPAELAYLDAAIRSFDKTPRHLKTIFSSSWAQTSATTGNLVLPLFTCPAGCEGHVTEVTVDAPYSTTITPAAPFSNASSWAFLAVSGASSSPGPGQVDSFRPGLVAFAPVTPAGPIIPGQWTFNDSSSPILRGGDSLYYCLHGGSVAAILGLALDCSYRVNLFGVEQGQL